MTTKTEQKRRTAAAIHVYTAAETLRLYGRDDLADQLDAVGRDIYDGTALRRVD